MWLKRLVGVVLIATLVGLFGITIGGLGFTRSDRVTVLNPDGTTREISAAEAAADPNLVQISSTDGTPVVNGGDSAAATGSGSSTPSSSSGTTTSGGTTTAGGTTTSGSTTGGGTTSGGGATGGGTTGGGTAAKPVVNMSISPATITSGGSSTISWSATNSPTSCTASGAWSGTKASSGSQSTVLKQLAPTPIR